MKVLIAISLVLGPLVSMAQDRLILNSGQEYEVKIIEETPDYVEFWVIGSPERILKVSKTTVKSIVRDNSSDLYKGLKDEARTKLIEVRDSGGQPAPRN